MQGTSRALLIGINAWISVCLLIAGWLPTPTPELHFMWLTSGLLGLVSSVGLSEIMKADAKAQESLINEYIEAAMTDGLTELANRQALNKALDDAFANDPRHQNSLCLIMIDIDYFKPINDQWGHQAGDDVLRSLSRKAVEFFEGKGCVARYGGEEFAVAMPNTKLKQAYALAEEFRKIVKHSQFKTTEQTIEITISAGIAEATARDNPESLIRRADLALYTAKKMGRDCIWIADSEKQSVESDQPVLIGA